MLTALAASAHALHAQQTPSAPVVRAGTTEIALGGRVHTQFNTTTAEGVPASEMVLRRVRLEANVKVNELVSGRVHMEFAGNRAAVRDAHLRLAFDPALQLIAGQAQRPFGILTQTTSNRILPIERGVRIRGVADAFDQHNLVADLGYADRDVGLQVTGAPRGAPLGVFYAAGYFNGPARNPRLTENTSQLVARAGVRPLRGVAVAGSWSRRDFVRTDTIARATTTRGGTAWAVDAEVGGFAPGVHLLGEASFGDFDPFSGTRFRGAQGWLAYRTPALRSRIQHVEPVLRVSYGDPDTR
ncbi:MAG: OprO/OprP family phosphate-selective porin, partial [Gemmatimonadota bacterium]|nr:OprO/OprP family phosphate-selective porin [Gemmatimonadota bacterium]